ncbi:MAG TPA: hypothetical protein VM581_02995 [Magnetospirillaceae bacterium]|nr:hypothetical protein [Magnetospirillaceae bacterium]
MTAAEILVIILSIALAIFLLLAIVLTVYLIVIAKKIKRIADTAEQGVQGFVGMLASLQRMVAPAVVTRAFTEIIDRFTRGRKDKKEDK